MQSPPLYAAPARFRFAGGTLCRFNLFSDRCLDFFGSDFVASDHFGYLSRSGF